MSSLVVTGSDLAKDMAGEPLMRGVSFRLSRGDRLTLAGRNGAGKTTLLRMLAGEAGIDGGELSLAKGVRVGLHDQRPPRSRDVSLRDYVLSGCGDLLSLEKELAALEAKMAAGATDTPTLDRYARAQAELEHAGGYTWRDQINSTLHGLGFADRDFDRPLTTFSGGELTRASLARVLAIQPDLLLLDEPTNHLDIESLEWLEEHLQTLDAAIVLVAHDRWFLEAVGTAVLELEGGRARYFNGTWHNWRKEKAAREIALGRQIEREQEEIARLERFVARFSAGTRARQAQSRAKRLEKIERTERAPTDGRHFDGFRFQSAPRSGRVIFELENGEVKVGKRTLLRDADLWLERGEHVALVGANGTGKSTLMKVLGGERDLTAGKLKRGHNVTLGVMSQHGDELGNTGSVLEVTQSATGLPPNKARALLGQFLFSGQTVDKSVGDLSGGERKRLSLAILVSSRANVLLLDEPTNHLDVESREALESALERFDGSLILISHDRALLDAVGRRTVAIEDAQLNSYNGGWAEYLRMREERREAKELAERAKSDRGRSTVSGDKTRAAATKQSSGKTNKQDSPKSNGGLSKNAKRQLAKLEKQIEAAEARFAALEDELADPSAWSDSASAQKSTEAHQTARSELDGLYAKWEELSR